MLGVTLFGIFLTPVFFYVIQWVGETRLFAGRGHALGRLGAARRAARGGGRVLAAAARHRACELWAAVAGGRVGARRWRC